MPSPTLRDVILDRYELTALLGQGGMGVVFAAHDRTMDQTVALKFLLADVTQDPEAATRFQREARAGRRLTNKHVALVYEVGTHGDQHFMAMEYLRGKDLAAVLRERGPLPVPEAVDFVLQAGEAVNEAHTLDIVHRDLKPGNLFLTQGADGLPLLKVLDFGISKLTSTDDASLTASAGVVGSPRYMSPEQLTAPRSVDHRSDIWALGVVLYELLAGVPPFVGATVPAVCAAIVLGEYPKLSSVRSDLPAGLDEVLADAMAGKRDERIPSVEALAARLAPFGTQGARDSRERIERVATHARASTAESLAEADAASASGVVARTATGQVDATQMTPSPPPATPARPPRRSVSRLAVGGAVIAATALGLLAWRGQHAVSGPPCAAGATEECEAACTARAPGSCHALAMALEKGVGAKKDSARAATVYQTDCDAGSLASCNLLGSLYARGDGVAKDNKKAFAIFMAACDGGFVSACVNRGSMEFDGDGVAKNEPDAVAMFLAGCDKGEPFGCLNLSVAYGAGRGGPKSPELSLKYAHLACAGNVLAGCAREAAAKLTGEGVAKDVRGGRAELDALCTREERTACGTLAATYMTGLGADAPADPIQARVYARKGCALNDTKSCDVKTGLEAVDKSAGPASQISAMFDTMCKAGRMEACESLGDSLMTGNGATVDRPRAIAAWQKACREKRASACRKLVEAGVK